ncbi:MAG: hypothetical protein KME42_01670 [Tildeniella nuda ZEHNDER 1965/U140]|jgi:hypothetical protein|nr:hypothetical protein [Tildeniella nuda ZEHNDER 1965/U140]
MSYTRHTTWERLYSAVGALAVGSGDIQERLQNAFVVLSALKAEEFPEELRNRVPFVYRSGDEGTTKESLSHLTYEEARKLTEEILYIYDTIAREHCTPE